MISPKSVLNSNPHLESSVITTVCESLLKFTAGKSSFVKLLNIFSIQQVGWTSPRILRVLTTEESNLSTAREGVKERCVDVLSSGKLLAKAERWLVELKQRRLASNVDATSLEGHPQRFDKW
jgi:uncharacterized membrane protein